MKFLAFRCPRKPCVDKDLCIKSNNKMPGNKARRFTKIQYDDPEDDDVIGRVYISSEEHTINSILRSLISHVEFIAILPGVLQVKADTDVVDGELSRALQEHLTLEQRLEMLEDQRLPGGENELTQLEKNIKSSSRNLLRLLKTRPLLLSAWKKELGKEIGKCERALIKELSILGGLEPKPLPTAPKQLAVSSDPKDSALVQDVSATIEEVTTKISQKRQEITTLQSSLQKQREEESALEEQLQTSIEESEIMQNKLQQEIDHMTAQVNEVLYRNFEEEAALRQKIKQVDAITEHFINDFDQEMEALQASLDLNTMKYEQEVEEVKRLEMLYTELDVEYRYILEKRRLLKEKEEKEVKELELKTKAALLMQAWWRGYCVRKALREKEKKGKGKKGKKDKASKEKGKIGKGQKDTKFNGKANGKKTV